MTVLKLSIFGSKSITISIMNIEMPKKKKIDHNLTLNLPDKVDCQIKKLVDYPWVETWAIWAHKCHQSVWKTWPQGVVEMSLSNVNESKQVEQATFIFLRLFLDLFFLSKLKCKSMMFFYQRHSKDWFLLFCFSLD